MSITTYNFAHQTSWCFCRAKVAPEVDVRVVVLNKQRNFECVTPSKYSGNSYAVYHRYFEYLATRYNYLAAIIAYEALDATKPLTVSVFHSLEGIAKRTGNDLVTFKGYLKRKFPLGSVIPLIANLPASPLSTFQIVETMKIAQNFRKVTKFVLALKHLRAFIIFSKHGFFEFQSARFQEGVKSTHVEFQIDKVKDAIHHLPLDRPITEWEMNTIVTSYTPGKIMTKALDPSLVYTPKKQETTKAMERRRVAAKITALGITVSFPRCFNNLDTQHLILDIVSMVFRERIQTSQTKKEDVTCDLEQPIQGRLLPPIITLSALPHILTLMSNYLGFHPFRDFDDLAKANSWKDLPPQQINAFFLEMDKEFTWQCPL